MCLSVSFTTTSVYLGLLWLVCFSVSVTTVHQGFLCLLCLSVCFFVFVLFVAVVVLLLFYQCVPGVSLPSLSEVLFS